MWGKNDKRYCLSLIFRRYEKKIYDLICRVL